MKTSFISSGFALLVVALNWNSTTITQTDAGTTRTTIDGAGLVVVCCLPALFLLSRSIYTACRRCLAEGVRVPSSARLLNFWPCLLLLPLLVHSQSGSTNTSIHGVIVTCSQGFGSAQSMDALILAILTIVAFQFRSGLSSYLRSTPTA